MKKPICINIYRKGISFFSTIIFEKGIKYTKEYSKEKLFYMKKEIEMIVGKNQINSFLKDYENIVQEMIIIGLKEGKLFNRLHFFLTYIKK